MNLFNDERSDGLERLGGRTLALIALILVSAGSGLPQSVPASISTIQQPGGGHTVLDSFGNTYYLGGPPTAGAAQTESGGGTCFSPGWRGIPIPMGCPDASAMKVDPFGNQIWGTRLGGPTRDKGTALAIDASGNVVLTGSTDGQFPTTPGAAIGSSESAKAFATKVKADGSEFLYSTYLPEFAASSSAIALDAGGSAYIGGETSAGGAFVLKLSADGSSIDYTVTLGGGGADAISAITVDPAGNALVAGQTTSRDFPVTAGAFQQNLSGTRNVFLVKLSPSGSVLASTYFGGSGSDTPSSIALDSAGNINLAGFTSSLDLPTTQGTMQPSPIVPLWNTSAPGGFVAQFAPDGISLRWASYVLSTDSRPTGSSFDLGVSALAIGPDDDIYLAGRTGPGFPVTPSAPVICFQSSNIRNNGFLAHLSSAGALMDATYLGSNSGGDVTFVGTLLPLPSGTVLIGWSASPYHVVSKVQFGGAGWTAPACLSTNVLNSATLDGSGGVAPGQLVTLTGFGIGPDAGVAYEPDAEGNVPTELAGVQVLFDGAPAPVVYVQSRQINAIAPAGLAVNGTTHVTVTYDQQFGPAAAMTRLGNPGVFRRQAGQAVAINQDGTLNGPMNPAARGSIVAVWGTGYGQTDPPCEVGGLNLPYAAPLSPGISAIISGIGPNGARTNQRPARYAGSAPTLVCGVVQINFQVPEDAAPGTFSFLPSVRFVDGNTTGGYWSGIGATIAVK